MKRRGDRDGRSWWQALVDAAFFLFALWALINAFASCVGISVAPPETGLLWLTVGFAFFCVAAKEWD